MQVRWLVCTDVFDRHFKPDLVIFTLGQPSGQPSVIAYAGACRLAQNGRAVAGTINWCPKFIYTNETAPTTNLYWQGQMGTACVAR
jgi:hypothetical protein